MRIVVADWETYFNPTKKGDPDDYTISRLSTEAYVRDPRFEAHGCAIKWSANSPAQWYDQTRIRRIMAEEDWSDVLIVHHHAHFDSLIESYHYNCHPKMIACTLSMARMFLGTHHKLSLDALRTLFGMPLKSTPYSLFQGKHWNELSTSVQEQVADGACDETESIWTIFNKFMRGEGTPFPLEEMEVMDAVIKMFTEPMLRADTALLKNIWEREAAAKDERKHFLKVTEKELQSANRFAELLRDAGIDVEYKQGKNGPIPAFAKTDDFMRDLLEDPDDYIRGLAEGRLKMKSTFMQTRAETLGWTASRGALPVYLNYSGASTLRVSGGDKCNWLNFKRQSDIRKSILAPEGYVLAPVDSSQIEVRCLHFLAGGPDEPVIQKFREGADPYVDVASTYYGEKIYKPKENDPRKAEMEAKRGLGKQSILMCGYGASGKAFRRAAKNGLYGPPVDIPIEEASEFVRLYRVSNPSITAKGTGYWAQCDRMIARLAGGPPTDWGPLHVRDHRIYLPNGCPLVYDTMEFHRPEPGEEVREWEEEGYWRVRSRQGWKKMFGARLAQNLCEAVSRVIISQAMIRITRMGYRVLNWPYDELLLLIPKDGKEQWHLDRCKAEMVREVPWLPGLPLDCEGSFGERYSK